MNPASRNLFRATEPEYLEDGTPKVTILTHVLQQGLANQRDYILGQFYICSPPPCGMIYSVFNKLWGRKCRITIHKLGESVIFSTFLMKLRGIGYFQEVFGILTTA